MLQQTTIAAVMPYYERFREQFPTVADLADAEESQVLRLWEGLGYYSRARNLHRAAKVIVEQLDGQFPQTVDDLQQLPGIGPYTARAIASVALGQPVGILEANTLRLYSRLIELEVDPRSTAGNRLLWEFADWIVAPRSASAFNQAAMDLGSTICTPDAPACDRCPVRANCCSARSNRQHELPIAAAKKQMTDVTEVAFVIRRGGKVLLKQYETGERWAGLWDFVRFSVSIEAGDQLLGLPRPSEAAHATLFEDEASQLAITLAMEQTGLQIGAPGLLKQIRHTVTRYRVRLLCLQSARVQGAVDRSRGLKWMPLEKLEELPLSTTARKIADMTARK